MLSLPAHDPGLANSLLERLLSYSSIGSSFPPLRVRELLLFRKLFSCTRGFIARCPEAEQYCVRHAQGSHQLVLISCVVSSSILFSNLQQTHHRSTRQRSASIRLLIESKNNSNHEHSNTSYASCDSSTSYASSGERITLRACR
jgi:hypothetical protein